MKTLSLFFLTLFSSLLVDAGTYTYDRVQLIESGSGVRFSQQTVVDKPGTIILNRNVIIIDDREYKLKETRDRWKFKIKGGIVRLDYESGNLIAIRIHRYNQAYKYCIQTNAVTQKR